MSRVRRMKLHAWVSCLSALTAIGLMAAAPAETDPRRDIVVEVVDRVMPSVVNIATEEIVEYRDPFAELFREFWGPYYQHRPRSTRYSLGSGVIIDEEGYVLTNLHVVQRASRIWVQLPDGREYEAQPIVGTTRRDVALLRLLAPEGETFEAIRFADDGDLLLGETVLALGNPFGLGGSVSRGILSSKNRRPMLESDDTMAIEDWLQTDAAINPGSSGGPLVDLRGELIGLNVAVHSEGQGIGFAIPVKQIAEALSEIFIPEVQTAQWFGLQIRSGTGPLRVQEIDRGSPAEKAGLRPGDLILRVGQETPRSFVHCMVLLAEAESPVGVEVSRSGERRSLTVKPVSLQTLVQQRLGLTLQEMDAALAQQFGLRAGQGLVVTQVEAGGPAAQANLEAGHVITAIDDLATPDLVGVFAALADKPAQAETVLTVLVEQRRGRFARLRQARVQIQAR